MKASYHSNRGEKSALLLIDLDPFTFGLTPVYVPRTAVANHEVGDEFEMPDHYGLTPLTGEDGEPRTTKTGETLMTLKRK